MPVELPFNPVGLLLAGLWQGLGMFAGWVWELPLAVKLLLLVVVLVRVLWPELLAEAAPVRRRRFRWRRNRRKWDD